MRAIFRWLTDHALAESIAGDLEEQRRRRAERSPIGAALWFWRRSLAIAAFFVFANTRALVRRLMANGPGVGRRGEFGQTLRSLRRTPWYSLTVIGVIALGMSLATTVFALVDGVLFKPLPYRAPNELFTISGSYLNRPAQRVMASARDLRDWSSAAPDVPFAAIRNVGPTARLGGYGSRVLNGAWATPNVLDVVGARPLIGGFTAGDLAADAKPSPALISAALWQELFGGRFDVIGQNIVTEKNVTVARVAGVLPPGFLLPAERDQPDVVFPLVLKPQDFESRGQRQLRLIGRVPAAEMTRVQAELDAAARAAMPDFPANSRLAYGAFDHVGFTPIADTLTKRSRPAFLLIFSAAAALVLLGCVNLAGLATARAEHRMREIALRRGLGASTWTLVRQQWLEAAALAVAGAATGLCVAPVLLKVTLTLLPADVFLLKEPRLDVRVLAFAAIAASVVALIISLWPAIVSARTEIRPMLTTDDAGRTTRRLGRRFVVSVQVALAFVLTIGGTFVVGSLISVWRNDPGYPTSDMLFVEAGVPRNANEPATASTFADVLGAVPGVNRVGWLDGFFLMSTSRGDISWNVPEGAVRPCLAGPKSSVSSRFFDVFGIELKAGRLPTPLEFDAAQPVAVLSQRQANACWPGRNAVGQTFTLDDHVFTVIGVVGAARLVSIDEENEGEVYVPAGAISSLGRFVMAARVSGSADRTLPAVVTALRDASLLGAVTRISTVNDALANSVKTRRLNAWLFGAFAAGALVIVGVGILGLTAMTTAERTREIGIRLALGATRDRVIGLLLREQIAAVAIGLAAGAAIAVWASQFVRAYLYGMTSTDSRVWIVAAVAIVAVAIGGTFIPSLRASRANPVQALRAD